MYKSEFSRQLNHKRRAGFGAVLIPTREQQQAEADIYNAFMVDSAESYRPKEVFLWSSATGLKRMLSPDEVEPAKGSNDLMDQLQGLVEYGEGNVFVFCDTHFYLENDPMLRRLLLERIRYARMTQNFIILLQKQDSVHNEHVDEVSIIRHTLPTREESRKNVNTVLTQYDFPTLCDKGLDNIQGLTAMSQINGVTLCMINAIEDGTKEIDVTLLRKHKEAEISKLPFLKAVEPAIGLDDIVGHDLLKQFIKTRSVVFTEKAIASNLPRPKGVMLAGPPGTGKTRISEAWAKAWEIPLLQFDFGGAFSSLLGETEQNINTAIEIAEAMSPCILMIDEVDSVLGNSKGGGEQDGGTTQRAIGKILTWLSTKTKDVYVLFTANHPNRLKAAMMRRGRLDQIFFMDFPTKSEREAIWRYYLGKKENCLSDADVATLVKVSDGWVGAEIESVVNDAHFPAFVEERAIALSDITAECEKMVPISKSMAGEVQDMRDWATNNAVPTSTAQQKEKTTKRDIML